MLQNTTSVLDLFRLQTGIIGPLFVCILCVSCKKNGATKQAVVQPDTPPAEVEKVKPYQPMYSTDYLMGKFEPKGNKDFVTIDAAYADRSGMMVRKEVYDAFLKMHRAAQQDGVKLVIRSATRNHDYQRGIWERKWTGKTILSDGTNAKEDIADDEVRARKILEYSSMPGTSRHHWGTDIDLNAFNNEYFTSGQGLLVFEWLEEHAAEYGFARPYTAKDSLRPHGYEEEKWHWSYLPLSTTMTHDAKVTLRDSMISGFMGDHTAPLIGVVENYILGINQSCKAWH